MWSPIILRSLNSLLSGFQETSFPSLNMNTASPFLLKPIGLGMTSSISTLAVKNGNFTCIFQWGLLWTQGVFLESPPSFWNGLGTIYIVSFSRKDFWSYYQSMGSEFRYVFGKVLGTQDYLTLRLASHHCVLCFNFIKNMFNTLYPNSHTH